MLCVYTHINIYIYMYIFSGPPAVVVTIRDNEDYIRILLFHRTHGRRT